jgi:putative flavoprotein involved in K+ transport
MNRSTTGLRVLFFNVTITAGHDWAGNSTGSALIANRSP